jgi:membrane fusion protein (multidrug efflux system)
MPFAAMNPEIPDRPSPSRPLPPAGNPPTPPPHKRWTRLVVLSLVALASVLILALFSSWVYYRWQHTVTHNATVDGKVKTVEVQVGQRVAAGQVLVRLEDDQYVAAVGEAQAQLQSAINRLAVEKLAITEARRELTLEMEHAQSDCTTATGTLQSAIATQNRWEQEYNRVSTLLKSGIGSQSDLDTATWERDSARAQVTVTQGGLSAAEAAYQLARAQLEEGLKVREAGLTVFTSDVDVVRQELAKDQADLAATVICCPADGWVIDRDVQPGGSAKVGETLISLWLGAPWVEAWVDEKTLSYITVGSPVDVTLQAFPKIKLQGQVEEIGVLTDTALAATADPQAKSVPDTLHSLFLFDAMVPIRITVEDPPVRLQPGLTALVGIGNTAPAAGASQRVDRGEIVRDPPRLVSNGPMNFKSKQTNPTIN